MSEAVEALLKQKQEIIDSCARRVAELDAWVAKIRAEETKRGKSLGPVPVDIPVRPGQYKGLRAGLALQTYLSERGGGPIEVDRVVHDLIQGGADLGTSKDRKGLDRRPRVVRMAIANNRKFRYADQTERSVELAERVPRFA